MRTYRSSTRAQWEHKVNIWNMNRNKFLTWFCCFVLNKYFNSYRLYFKLIKWTFGFSFNKSLARYICMVFAISHQILPKRYTRNRIYYGKDKNREIRDVNKCTKFNFILFRLEANAVLFSCIVWVFHELLNVCLAFLNLIILNLV